MELKATALGKHLAQHPYDRVKLLTAGVEVSGDRHQYLIPFNQLIGLHCKRGLVWGELEFELPDQKVVRLHGTEWGDTQRFYQHLLASWQRWSQEMADIAAQVLNAQAEAINTLGVGDKWLKSQDISGLQAQIRDALSALPLPHVRIEQFDVCQPAWALCMAWLENGESQRQKANQRYAQKMLEQHQAFFASVESSPLNTSQALAVVNGEASTLVLAGAGSGKTSVLVARAGWLIARREAMPDQILMLAFGRKAADEMDDRIRQRLNTDEITSRTFHALALYIIQQAGRKAPQISQLESDTQARQALLIETWRQQCHEKKAQAKGWRQWLTEELGWTLREQEYWLDDKLCQRLAPRLDRWLGLIRMNGGAQATMIAECRDDLRDAFQKRVKLMAPVIFKGCHR